MILKASQRGGGMALASHLLKSENEHVEIHEVRGFVTDDVRGAFKEAEAVVKGTRCKQHLFSVSFNPPADAIVSVAKFEAAIERVEEANGLKGQPRIVIFHEKEGRRHAHCVWSRIDAETMIARPLPFFKAKLRDIAKGLYLEHGWHLPRGFVNSREHDPRNFSLAEWQQAKRMGQDPRALKAAIQECWAASDDGAAFSAALEARGLYLARGDRRGHVAVTYEGEAVSLARAVGIKNKDVTAKLGKPEAMRSVEETKVHIAQTVSPRLKELIRQTKANRARDLKPLDEKRLAMAERHGAERQRLRDGQQSRSEAETRSRAARFRSGVAGIWDRLTGRHAATRKENERETFEAFKRDRSQRDALVADQMAERRSFQRNIVMVREQSASQVLGLFRDLTRQRGANETVRVRRTEGRSAERARGPDLGR